ncbi:UDP-N-acetylmuramate--L-alanine ligase [Salinivirga cyanobacteriivorans]
MKQKKHIFFVGIGGIGMSALARYFNLKGYTIAGYDLTPTSLTHKLEKEGITITYNDDINQIPQSMRNPDDVLVVYTPAIPHQNNIISYFRNNTFEVIKRAALLGKVTQNYKSIAIAGTHGKTSISTFTAHLLYQSSLKCNAFLGGISANYQSNLLFDKNAAYTVIEADEYDRSFLHLNPHIALITSVDADHLDIYGSYSEVKKAFNKFAQKALKEGGRLIIHKDVLKKTDFPSQSLSYSTEDKADYQALNTYYNNGEYTFDLATPKGVFEDLKVNLPGSYNFENALAAAALAIEAGIEPAELREGLASLKGVERRFQVHINQNITYIDDYAHHPKEIEACIKSARHAFPGKKITVAFQPHLYSRTNDFSAEFAEALDLADYIFLLPIYPAREEPIAGVTSQLIGNKLTKAKYQLINKTEVVEKLKKVAPETFISMGAGDIGFMVDDIKKTLNQHLR